jgi:hypothetical protein
MYKNKLHSPSETLNSLFTFSALKIYQRYTLRKHILYMYWGDFFSSFTSVYKNLRSFDPQPDLGSLSLSFQYYSPLSVATYMNDFRFSEHKSFPSLTGSSLERYTIYMLGTELKALVMSLIQYKQEPWIGPQLKLQVKLSFLRSDSL